MILIDNIFVDESILTTSFCCDLQKCMGACCVEGESGAPLSADELDKLEKVYPVVKQYLPAKNRRIAEAESFYVKDSDGDWTTPIIGKNGPCVYATFKDNVAYCAIEQAFRDKKIDWQKPASCHLYPIRVEYKNGFTYLYHHRWSVCNPALKNGKIPMFRFLKDAIIKNFGESFYQQLEDIYQSIIDAR